MCYTVVLSSLLDPLYVSCFNVPVCPFHAPGGSRRERQRVSISYSVGSRTKVPVPRYTPDT